MLTAYPTNPYSPKNNAAKWAALKEHIWAQKCLTEFEDQAYLKWISQTMGKIKIVEIPQ